MDEAGQCSVDLSAARKAELDGAFRMSAELLRMLTKKSCMKRKSRRSSGFRVCGEVETGDVLVLYGGTGRSARDQKDGKPMRAHGYAGKRRIYVSCAVL